MSTIWLEVARREEVADSLQFGRFRKGLTDLAGLAGADLAISDGNGGSTPLPASQDAVQVDIRYRGEAAGRVVYLQNGNTNSLSIAAATISSLVEHAIEREAAVGDLAKEMVTSFEELTMLYSLLPNIAAKEDTQEIGELLVAESARTLNCRRVSLLLLDEKKQNLTVLASRGLPEEAKHTTIPVSTSIAGQALLDDDFLIVNNVADRPDLAALSLGDYDTPSFSIVRVPLRAQGDALGVLTATERIGDTEFTARDHKLLAGLSAVGSSALMNCRLHATINRQMLSTIEALALAVDAKDPYTHEHSRRVSNLCVATARVLGMKDPNSCREVRLAGLLHDIGKIGVADHVLRKKGPLSPDEFALIKSHAVIGARIAARVEGLEHVSKAILHHHERYDGLGYPLGLTGETTPMMAKLITVADCFDSLTSDRPYRKARSREEAVAELKRSTGTQLDPNIVKAFLEVIDQQMNQSSS